MSDLSLSQILYSSCEVQSSCKSTNDCNIWILQDFSQNTSYSLDTTQTRPMTRNEEGSLDDYRVITNIRPLLSALTATLVGTFNKYPNGNVSNS